MRLYRAVALVALWAAGCNSLPDIAPGVCGNHIVEADKGEDCDSPDSAVCIQPRQAHECHRPCSAGPCPAGDVCEDGACVQVANVCGNGVLDPGEDCDSVDSGCVPPGQPGACHMRCDAYPSSRCPPGKMCDARGLCLAAPAVCGNGFVDPGEECDGSSGCIPAGKPDQCKLTCAAHRGGECPPGATCGATGACVASPGICGNHQVEPGEDCDGSSDCGAPGTSAACRLSCARAGAPDAPCPLGYVCGSDKICRQPTGYYTLSPPLGRQDEIFALEDLDGDGVIDLTGRGPHETTLWRNDGGGNLSIIASGVTPPRPVDQAGATRSLAPPQTTPGLAFFSDPDTRLMSAVATHSAALFRIVTPVGGTTAALQPLITPGIIFSADSSEKLVGLVHPSTHFNSGPVAIFSGQRQDGLGPYLEYYVLDIDCYLDVSWCTGAGSRSFIPELTKYVSDLCGGIQPTTMSASVSVRGPRALVTLLLDGKSVCLVDTNFDFGQSEVKSYVFDIPAAIQFLAAQPQSNVNFDSRATIGQPGLLDLDGDGNSDLLVPLFYTNGDASPDVAFLYWLHNVPDPFDFDHSFSRVYSDEQVFDFSPVAGSAADVLGVADFDHDGLEEPVIAGTAYRTVKGAGSERASPYHFVVDGTYQYPTVRASDHPSLRVADLDGDGLPEIVQGFVDRPDLLVCHRAKAGTPFVCNDQPTGLMSIAGLVTGDVGGDGRVDLVSFGRGTPAWGSPSMLSVRAGNDGNAAPVAFAGYHADIVGGAMVLADLSAANKGQRRDIGVIVRIHDPRDTVNDGAYAFALSHLNLDGSVDFGTQGAFSDVRTTDLGDDGRPDIILSRPDTGELVMSGPSFRYTRLINSQGDVYLMAPRFLDAPGQPYPLLASGLYGGEVTLDAYQPSPVDSYRPADTGLSGKQWATKVQDVDGDGKPELVAFDPDGNVAAGTIDHGTASLRAIARGSANGSCDDVFFVDVAPLDGRPDLLYEVRVSDDQPTHLLLSRARADGTYDDVHALLDPPLARDAGSAHALVPGAKWVGRADLNGDRIDDLVFWTADGAVVAFAEVARR